MNSGGRSRFSQTRDSLGCADTGEASVTIRARLANAPRRCPANSRPGLMSRANKRLSSDGSVFAQLCDLRRVIAKFLEYLGIVLTQLRPDPFTITGCL